MKQKIVTGSKSHSMKDDSFEDFEKDNRNVIFLKKDGTVVEKEDMFTQMGGALPG